MNTIISSDLAILLKDIGYFIQYKSKYASFSRYHEAIEFCKNYPNKLNDDSYDILDDIDNEGSVYSCRIILNEFDKLPTISDVVMWIYEKHNIWIYSFNEDCVEKTFGYNISLLDEEETELYSFDRVAKSIYSGVDGTRFKSPTKAYEAAIGYCLNNLINQ